MSTLFDDLSMPGLGPETSSGREGAGGGVAWHDVTDEGVPTWAEAAARGGAFGGERHTARSPEALLEGLNPQQRAAVVHEGGPLLIVAGAGSGKTRVLTHRIAWLLDQRGAQPGQLLAITVTNKAATEMRERVAALVGPRARAMWVMTFHSACVRILRREAAKVGLKSTFSIYDAADSQRLMALVLRDLDLDPKRYPPRSFAAQVSNLKNELVDEETFAARAAEGNHHERTLAEAYTAYQRRLRQANALDFDDIIMVTVNILQAFPDVAEHYRRRFRHILVDEYQDTNVAQYQLIRELVGEVGAGQEYAVPPAELVVVGDSDQSIYAFRGASIRNILEFEKDYPDAGTILLEQNYRSTQRILRAANAVIARNEGRPAKHLWTDSGDGALIVGYVADNEHDEAAFIAKRIDELEREDGTTVDNLRTFKRYCEFLGLPVGSQMQLFDAPQGNGMSQQSLLKHAAEEGYARGVMGKNPDDQAYPPLSPEGQEHMRGWSDGQGVLKEKFIKLSEAMADAEKEKADKKAKKAKKAEKKRGGAIT